MKDLPPRVLETVQKGERRDKFDPRSLPAPAPSGAVSAEGTTVSAPPKSAPAAADGKGGAKGTDIGAANRNLNDFLQEQESNYIRAVLDKVGGDKKEAAKLPGVSIATLYRKLGEQPTAN